MKCAHVGGQVLDKKQQVQMSWDRSTLGTFEAQQAGGCAMEQARGRAGDEVCLQGRYGGCAMERARGRAGDEVCLRGRYGILGFCSQWDEKPLKDREQGSNTISFRFLKLIEHQWRK